MATMTKYPTTVSQTTGGNYRDWKNLANVKNHTSGSYATSNGNVRGKSSSPNRPSAVTATNFRFSLPVGADVVSVKVSFGHRKEKVGSNSCNIPAPTLSLVGVSGVSSRKTYAPSLSFGDRTYTFKHKNLTRAVVNSSNFGVKIDYPKNTNEFDGTLSLGYIRVQVEYKVPSYTVSVKKLSGGYNNERYSVVCSISNKSLVKTSPSCTLTAPVGFSYVEGSGSGSVQRVNARTLTWQPNVGSKGVAYREFVFDVDVTFAPDVDTYQGIFTLVESLNQSTGSFTATIYKYKPVDEETEPDSPPVIQDEEASFKNPEVHTITIGDTFNLNLNTADWMDSSTGEDPDYIFGMVGVCDNQFEKYDTLDYSSSDYAGDKLQYDYYNDGDWSSFNSVAVFVPDVYMDGSLNILFKGTVVGEYVILISKAPNGTSDWSYFKYVKVHIRPTEDDLTAPNFTYFEVTGEEMYRLGDQTTYTAQADIKHTTEDTFERDWYKNNRIGVFNNPILENITITETTDPETGEITETYTDTTDYDNLTTDEIFENAEYWGEPLTTINEYNSSTCEFTYNKDYPLYIILAGDYNEATTYDYDTGTTTYDNVCIVESNTYKERLLTGTYPISIINLLPEYNEDISNLVLEGNSTGETVILYDYDLDDDYGTNETLVVRGIELNANVEYSDNISITARLINPNGEIGSRSIILLEEADQTSTLTLGGIGDLWSFKPSQLVDLKDWEIELITANTLSDEESTITFNNVQLIIYVEKLLQQKINVTIEDESLSAYGAFLEEVNIPEGLETDTSFINVAGTDTNDAYRQNIREKKITLNMSLLECEFEANTLLLQQLTQLLVNEKDEYNRPIPKRITFSHYPNSYFEYILEDALDITEEAGAYSIKAELTIPAGTSYSLKDTVTNTNGIAHGLAAVNPIITIKASEETFEIKENITEQTFNMSVNEDNTDKIIEINCEDRKVYLKTDEDDTEGIDISASVDMGSDWFRLHGEYEFEANGAVIRTIRYNERW